MSVLVLTWKLLVAWAMLGREGADLEAPVARPLSAFAVMLMLPRLVHAPPAKVELAISSCRACCVLLC